MFRFSAFWIFQTKTAFVVSRESPTLRTSVIQHFVLQNKCVFVNNEVIEDELITIISRVDLTIDLVWFPIQKANTQISSTSGFLCLFAIACLPHGQVRSKNVIIFDLRQKNVHNESSNCRCYDTNFCLFVRNWSLWCWGKKRVPSVKTEQKTNDNYRRFNSAINSVSKFAVCNSAHHFKYACTY